jgi:hypothetical protein
VLAKRTNNEHTQNQRMTVVSRTKACSALSAGACTSRFF